MLAVIIAIIGGAALYIYKAKKKGIKCIGCPEGANCGGNCSGGCAGCSGNCGK